MSTVAIDASRANRPGRTGTEWYAYHLIEELKAVIPARHRVILYSAEPLRDGLERLPENWESRVLSWPPKRLWTQVRLSWEMLRRPPDLLFVPVHAMPVLLPKRSVTTLHDVAFMTTAGAYSFSERRYQRFAVRHALRRAGAILTVSEFSRSELVRHFRADPSKIAVTHLGYDDRRFGPVADDAVLSATASRYGVRRPYFLFVGRLEAKKNIGGLFDAFERFRAANPHIPHDLLLVGKRGYGAEKAFEALEKSSVRRSVIEAGYVCEEDMRALYASAAALVFPSWYEGFGLPVIEAFACGAPVICSNVTSLPEVAGDAAALVPPGDAQAIADAMRRVVADDAFRRSLIERGFARAKGFAWKTTAERTWSAIEKLLRDA